MPVSRYKIKTWGDPVGRSALAPRHVFPAAIAKAASDANPYAVGNELLCNKLAQALGLPVPPGFISEEEDDLYFVALNFLLAGEDLPPANAPALVAAQPELTWGIILFDAWVVNGDRHNQNLAYDEDRGRVMIFDHSHAFFEGTRGRAGLEEAAVGLGIRNHCLAQEVTTVAGFDEWVERIGQLPEFLIEGAVRDAVECGLPQDDEEWCTEFLLDRRSRLRDLVMGHAEQAFPKLELDLWHQGGQADKEEPNGVDEGEAQAGEGEDEQG